MPRTKISEFSATPGDNTDIDGIDIAEGCAPSGINNAIRELMAQLKDMQTGSSGDTFTLTTVNSTTVDTTNLEVTNLKAKDGTSAGSIANSTGVVTLASSVLTTADINGGTVDGTTIGATTPSTVVATQVDITAQGDLRLQDTTGGQYVALQAPATIATSYTLTLPVDDGTSGQALITDGSGVLSWSSAASGDVYGPASATDNAVARYDGTTGKIIQNSAVTIADDGATVIAANSSSDGLRITQIGAGNALVVEDSANPDATPTVIDASGNVGIGATSPTQAGLVISKVGSDANTSARLALKSNETSASTYMRFGRFGGGDDSLMTIGNNYNRDGGTFAADYSSYGVTNILFDDGFLSFGTGAAGSTFPTERMRINSVGAVGIGGTPGTGQTLFLQKSITGNIDSTTVRQIGTVASDVTSSVHAFDNVAQTAATAFTLSNYRHFVAQQGSFGAGSTVTNQYGFWADGSLTGATNDYGFYGNIASGTGRYNFYAAGTAANYFAGNVGVGITTPATNLDVAGSSSTSFPIIRITDTNTASATQVQSALQFYSADASSPAAASVRAQIDTFANANGGASDFRLLINDGTLTERFRIASAGTISLGAAPGAESLRVTPVASAVNYYNVTGGATGQSPYLQAAGSDTNIHSQYLSKGTFGHIFNTGTAGNFQFYVSHTASAVNYIQVQGGITGSPAITSAQGSDANVSLQYLSKGTGNHNFGTAGGTAQFLITHTASAVNYLQVSGAATGGVPIFRATGSDTNVPLTILTKGTGYFNFQSGGGTQFFVGNTASAVNYLQVTGGATGTAVAMSAQGSDTNIDLALTPKGTGNVRFGTYTAGILAQAGYITIKDAAGNTRNLLVG